MSRGSSLRCSSLSRFAAAGALFLLPAALPVDAAKTPTKTAGETSTSDAAPFRYDSRGRRDPFVPLVRDGRLVASGPGVQSDQSKPVLYGILWDPTGHSIALINDTEVKEGDRIGNYQVKEIQHDAVVLDNGGEPMVLKIAFDAPPAKLSPHTTKGGEGP